MFRTMKYHYKYKNDYEKRLLMFLFHISKNLYNVALYTLRQLYFNGKNICTYFELNKILNNNENFHILNTYASICTIRQAHNSMRLFCNKHNKLPKYLPKKDVYAIYTDQVRPIIYKNRRYIKLPLSNLMRTNKIFKVEFKDPLIKEFINEIKINKIENKCEEHNINCIIINESYTSLSSFYDNDKIEKQETYSGKRIKRGLYLTKNKIEVNADVNASLNILRKSKPNDDEVIHYLRDRGLTIPKRLQVIL